MLSLVLGFLTAACPGGAARAAEAPGLCAELAGARRALGEARKAGDADQTVEALHALGLRLLDAYQDSEAGVVLEDALRQAERRRPRRPSKEAEILYALGAQALRNGPLARAAAYFKRGAGLAGDDACREALMRGNLGTAHFMLNNEKSSRAHRAAASAAARRAVALLEGLERAGLACKHRLNLYINAARVFDAFGSRREAAEAWAKVMSVMRQEDVGLDHHQAAYFLPNYVKHLKAVGSPELARFEKLAAGAKARDDETPAARKPVSCE